MNDVPSPIDLRDPTTAARWAAEANRARPYRQEVFERIAEELHELCPGSALLELGSGPGLLAAAILGPSSISRERLARHASRCAHIAADFARPAWSARLGTFDAVVTMQAVPGGRYLVCDHFAGAGGMDDHDLHATIQEQAEALSQAGFRHVRQMHRVGSLVLHRAVH